MRKKIAIEQNIPKLDHMHHHNERPLKLILKLQLTTNDERR